MQCVATKGSQVLILKELNLQRSKLDFLSTACFNIKFQRRCWCFHQQQYQIYKEDNFILLWLQKRLILQTFCKNVKR